MDNIHISRKYNEWATTIPNQNKLNEAFKCGKYIFLIYAVSKSFEFQGFARMTTHISNSSKS